VAETNLSVDITPQNHKNKFKQSIGKIGNNSSAFRSKSTVSKDEDQIKNGVPKIDLDGFREGDSFRDRVCKTRDNVQVNVNKRIIDTSILFRNDKEKEGNANGKAKAKSDVSN